MGFPEIQGCNPEITSCDLSSEASFSAPEKSPNASPEKPSPAFFSEHWEKYQKTGGVLYNSLWAPQLPDFRKESSFIGTKEREEVLGAYLASLPPSPEELTLTDTQNPLVANSPEKLEEAWTRLPLQVRAYLDHAGLKGEKNLGVVYETENPHFPEGRWRIFNWEEDKVQIAAAGIFGLGFLKPKSTSSTPTPPPNNKASMNVKLGSFAVGTALVIGVDFAVKKAFPHLPAEAQIYPSLASFYGIQYVIWQAGFTKAATWGEVWRPMTGQLPMMAMLGIPTSVLVDQLGKLFNLQSLRNHGDLHAPLTVLGTLGIHYGLMKTVVGRNFLTGSGGGFAGNLGKAVRVGGAALILSTLCRGARAGGSYAGLWFGGARPGSYAWREGQLLMLAEKLSLAQVSKDVFGDTGGSVIDGALGGLLDAILTIGELVSDDVSKGRQIDINNIRNQIREEGAKSSREIREKISLVAFTSLNENGEIKWDIMQKGLYEAYGNTDIMQTIYDNFEMTGQNNDEIEEVKLAIDSHGNIQNKDLLLKIIRFEFQQIVRHDEEKFKDLKTRQEQLIALGKDIGYFEIRGEDILQVPEAFLSQAQHERLQKEYLPLAASIVPLEVLQDQSNQMNNFIRNLNKK